MKAETAIPGVTHISDDNSCCIILGTNTFHRKKNETGI